MFGVSQTSYHSCVLSLLCSCQPHLVLQVDRSVSGLVAQQQCVGPLQTPLADVAVVALSHQELVGAATALGEQPVKSLLDPKIASRLAVTEALTNLVFALVTDLRVSPPQLLPIFTNQLFFLSSCMWPPRPSVPTPDSPSVLSTNAKSPLPRM